MSKNEAGGWVVLSYERFLNGSACHEAGTAVNHLGTLLVTWQTSGVVASTRNRKVEVAELPSLMLPRAPDDEWIDEKGNPTTAPKNLPTYKDYGGQVIVSLVDTGQQIQSTPCSNRIKVYRQLQQFGIEFVSFLGVTEAILLGNASRP